MWSKELHLHSRGWAQSSTAQLSLFPDSDCGLGESVGAPWRSEELLYLCEQPLHRSVLHSSSPLGAVQLRVTLEEWEGSVYLVRSSCT